jgi:hypothetical protein
LSTALRLEGEMVSFQRRVGMGAATTALALPIVSVAVGEASATTDDGVFLDSAISVNRAEGEVTLPLLRGTHHGKAVWYIVTESSNRDDAERRGVNHAPKLTNALGTRAVQTVRDDDGVVRFSGTVDFSPERVVVPGPQGFPPTRFQPGAVGDAAYSPLITVDGRTVRNASQVANASGLHDGVVAIDRQRRSVTLDTLNGFYEDERVQYLHQEGSTRLIAALEGSTYAPNLNAAPRAGVTEPRSSSRSAIIPIVNGPRGVDNPQRQGLESALLGQGDPKNITQTEPGDQDYSPMWDVTPAKWTPAAVRSGTRHLVTDADDVADLVEDGLLVSAGAGPRNQSLEGLRALPAVSNCPLVLELTD